MTSSVPPPPSALRWERDGAQLFPRVLDEPALKRLEEALSDVPTQVPGVRIKAAPRLLPFLDAKGPIGMLAAGARAVVVTRGAAGDRIHPTGGVTGVAAGPVRAVDTTGAGDAFIGTFAASLSAGMPLVEAVHEAARAGAEATTRAGAR